MVGNQGETSTVTTACRNRFRPNARPLHLHKPGGLKPPAGGQRRQQVVIDCRCPLFGDRFRFVSGGRRVDERSDSRAYPLAESLALRPGSLRQHRVDRGRRCRRAGRANERRHVIYPRRARE